MRAKGFGALCALVGLLVVAGAAGGAQTTNLPGGTPFSVEVASPHDGDVLPANTPFTVTGSAEVGSAAPVANTFLLTVIDVSGSTFNPVSTTACGNVNTRHDTTGNTVMDCELSAARALNNEAINQGTVLSAGIVGFSGTNGSVPFDQQAPDLDVSPAGGSQPRAAPTADVNGNGKRDIDEVLESAWNTNVSSTGNPPSIFPPAGTVGFSLFTPAPSGGQTNYWAAISQANAMLGDPAIASLKKVVVMLSDGEPNLGNPTGQPLTNTLALTPANTTFFTFAIGNSANCAGNGGNTAFGSLQVIANSKPGGSCTHITNPGDAAAVIPDAIGSSMSSFGLNIVGGATGAFDPPASITPSPPAAFRPGSTDTVNGPGKAAFARTYPAGAATGTRTLCARASGTDGGGSTPLTDCITVTFKEPPVITIPGDGPTGNAGEVVEGTAFTTGGSASGATATSWSAGSAPCTFADPTAVNTTVTCRDNGLFALTLTATDGVNPPVSATEHLLVTNASPSATLVTSPPSVPLGAPVIAHGTYADAGADDTHTCTFDWGDGSTPSSVTNPAGTCDGFHVYLAGGSYTVTLTVTDDDGDSGTATSTEDAKAPPVVTLHGDGPTGNAGETDEGSPFGLTADVGGATSTTWSYVGGTGTCTFGDATQPNTPFTCDDNGTYLVTLHAIDGFGQASEASEHIQVNNVPPHVTAPAGQSTHVGAPVTYSFPYSDAGAGDTHTCAIQWGDGTAEPGIVAGGTCTGTHAYASGGSFTVTATLIDDDHATGSAETVTTVDGPPSIGDFGPFTGAEGSPMPIAALMSDDHGATTHWTMTPGPGVDAGAICTFLNPFASPTFVTCTDDGTWNLTMTADDGVNAPTSRSTTVTVSNAAPTLSLGATTSNVTATVTGTTGDPGTNDTHTCSFAWGDGATTSAPVSGGTCTSSHTYAPGTHTATVSVTATDDDTASTTRSIAVTLNRAPTCTGSSASPASLWPPDHSFRLVTIGGCADADGDAVTYTIDGVRQDEALNGNGDGNTSPDARREAGNGRVSIRAERDGGGDGRVYTISWTASDGNGGVTHGTSRVGVPKSNNGVPAVQTPGVSVNSFG